MTHIMLADFKDPQNLKQTLDSPEIVADLVAIPSLVFDFHPNVVKTAEKNGVGSLKHTVFIKFKTEAPVGALVAGYIGLTDKIEEMKGFEWGPFANDMNRNGVADKQEVELTNGFEYVFITTFYSVKDRDAYLVHEAHDAYLQQLVPHMADFSVMDFVAY